MNGIGKIVIAFVTCAIVLGSFALGIGIVSHVQASSARHPRDIFSYIVHTFHDQTPSGGIETRREITINGLARNAHARQILTNLEIPASIDGVPVTVIGASAFASSVDASTGSSSLDIAPIRHVTIPGSVKIIRENAFMSMHNLRTVTLSDGLESIGGSAFWNCMYLGGLTIPGTVKSIGPQAFAYSFDPHIRPLTEIIIPASVTSIGESAFIGSRIEKFYVEPTTRPNGNILNHEPFWHPNWNETRTPFDHPTTFDVEWGVLTATYINTNGQVAMEVIRNSEDGFATAIEADGVLTLRTLDSLGFLYDHIRYIHHGWGVSKTSTEPAYFGGENLTGIDASVAFYAILQPRNNFNRRIPLTELVQAVDDFKALHSRFTHPEDYWDKLWTPGSWNHMIDMLNEAHELLGKVDIDIGSSESAINNAFNSAYRNLFYARLELVPLDRDDFVDALKDPATSREMLSLLIVHASTMLEEKQHVPGAGNRWTWTAFELALDEAKELLDEFPAGSTTIPDDFEKVFFALVDAMQTITMRYNAGVNILIIIGAVLIGASLVGLAAAIDSFGGRGATVKMEKRPWTTYVQKDN